MRYHPVKRRMQRADLRPLAPMPTFAGNRNRLTSSPKEGSRTGNRIGDRQCPKQRPEKGIRQEKS